MGTEKERVEGERRRDAKRKAEKGAGEMVAELIHNVRKAQRRGQWTRGRL